MKREWSEIIPAFFYPPYFLTFSFNPKIDAPYFKVFIVKDILSFHFSGINGFESNHPLKLHNENYLSILLLLAEFFFVIPLSASQPFQEPQ
jgi:hypothetical protein